MILFGFIFGICLGLLLGKSLESSKWIDNSTSVARILRGGDFYKTVKLDDHNSWEMLKPHFPYKKGN